MRFYIYLLLFVSSISLSAQDPIQSFYIDLGPNDGTNGNATASPDVNDTHWNNLTRSLGGEVVTLVNQFGEATPYSASVTERLSSNGINHGGLLQPQIAQLGEFAIATATQDYFFTTDRGQVTLAGLNPANRYRLTYFATRATNETRVTAYDTGGRDSDSGSLQTSGPGSGVNGGNGNNNSVYTTAPIRPFADGRITISILRMEGSFAYLGLMKVEELPGDDVTQVTAINLRGPETIDMAGAAVQYTAEVVPQDATFTAVTWSIDNPLVAHIDDEGLLTALSDGSVTITARSTEPGTGVLARLTVQISGQDGRSILVDCGSSDNTTASPDALGQAWNNATSPTRSAATTNLLTTTGEPTGWRLDVTRNGSQNGDGLANPPAGLLGSLGAATATSDYFFSANTATLTLRGLDPNKGYRLLAFGSRDGEVTESTEYTLGGLNAATAILQTSGPGSGQNGATANDDTRAISDLVKPFPDSTLEVSYGDAGGVFGFLNAFQVFEYDGFELCPERDAEEIVVLGSSVARGQGAPNDRGYAFQYGQLLNQRFQEGLSNLDWMVTNVSVGGDNTERVLARFGTDLVGQCGSYVIIGLSLANEGIRNGGQEVYDQFQENLTLLIDRSRAAGYEPVIVSNYPRGDYDAGDYAFIRNINQWIYQLDVPSVNVLGPVDDGNGRWLPSLQDDIGHPNLDGHEEFAAAFVPSLFDALAQNVPVPEYVDTDFIQLSGGGVRTRQLYVTPETGMRSFSFGLDFRAEATQTDLLYLEDSISGPRISFNAAGQLELRDPLATPILLSDQAVNNNEWHRLVVTYQRATAKVLVYLDGDLLGEVSGQLLPQPDFAIGDINAIDLVQVRQIVLYRANLNAEEVALWQRNILLQGSLELYVPGEILVAGQYDFLINYAQSLNELRADFSVSTNQPVSLAEGTLTAFPNPARDHVQFVHQAGRPISSVTVYDAVGRLIKATQADQIVTSDWPEGVYYARILVEGRMGVVRFLVK